MEHPDVIREIDALIDSYNWVGIGIPKLIAISIKQSVRLEDPFDRDLWRSPQAEFMVVHLFIQLLQHPRITRKDWILATLSQVLLLTFRRGNHPFRTKTYRALQNILPILRRYIRHQKAAYRLYSVKILSKLIYQSDEVVRCIIGCLNSERSPQIILKILNELGQVLSYKKGILIHPKTRQTVIEYLERIIGIQNPCIQLSAANLLIAYLNRSPTNDLIDDFAYSWSRLDRRTYRRRYINYPKTLAYLGRRKQLNRLIQLMVSTTQLDLCKSVWRVILRNYCIYPRSINHTNRRIVFTSEEKTAIEGLLLCKPLWLEIGRDRGQASYLTYEGLEPTRAALRQQLKHARIIDETEQFSQPETRFPLTLMQN